MPQLLIAGGVSGGLAVAFAPGAITAATFLTPFATTIALGFVGQVLAPDAVNLSASGPQDRQVMSRSTIAPRRYVLGRTQLSAANIPYIELTGTDREFLHLVLTLAQGEISRVDDILFDDNLLGSRNASGEVIDGIYAKVASRVHARIHVLTGTDSQVADPELVAESAGGWTADHRGRGVAGLVLRLHRDPDDTLYSSGIPQIRAVTCGVPVYDPRDAATRYTTNPALLLRWYLHLAREYGGFGAADAEIDDDAVATAANVCDERVAVATYTSPAVTADASTDVLTFATAEVNIGYGDGVTVASTGTLPAGLSAATTYYAIRLDGLRTKLATTYANALAGTAINLTSAGTGTITLAHVDQARYTCNGVLDTAAGPRQNAQAILSTMSGALVFTGGEYRMHAGAWTTPEHTLDESDLAGPVQCQVRPGRGDLFNGVRGTFTNPLRDYQPVDFPPYESAAFEAQDNGEKRLRDFDFQFVDNPIRAQRLAKLVLYRARQGMQLTLVVKLQGLEIALWDTVEVSLAYLGFVAKTFRVVGWSPRDESGRVVVLTLQEEDATVYGWTASEATALTPPPDLILPDVTAVIEPTSITLSSGTAELLRADDGTIISRLRVQWGAAPEPNISGYEIAYKRTTDTDYTTVTAPRDVHQTWIAPVEDGILYDVRVRTVAGPGLRRSSWVADTETVAGKSAAPTAPTTLTITAALGGYDMVWDACPDLDYARTEVWEAATNDRTGASRVANVAGTRFPRTALAGGLTKYLWLINYDRSGNPSTWYPSSSTGGASVVTIAATGGGIKTVSNASSITAGPGSPPPGGADYWAVFSDHDGKIWRWNSASGSYTKAADGGDLTAASVAADRLAVATLSAITADFGSMAAGNITMGTTDDNYIRGGATNSGAGVGFFIGRESPNYVFRVGDPGGQYIKWDGSTFTIAGTLSAATGTFAGSLSAATGTFAGALSAATGTFAGALSAATGTFAGTLSAATGTFAGSLSAATGTFAGALSAVTGSFGAVTVGDTLTINTTGHIKGGQTAYNTGAGFFLGYSGAAYKFSIGDPAGAYMTYDGTTLTVSGSTIDTRPFAAGTTAVASASTEIFMGASASTWTEVKAITCPRGGVLRCNWDAYAGTTGAQTKTRIYKNGVAVSSEYTHSTIGWHSQTYDITFAAGDSIELWAWWQSTQGKVRNFVLTNTFNENFFVVTLD